MCDCTPRRSSQRLVSEDWGGIDSVVLAVHSSPHSTGLQGAASVVGSTVAPPAGDCPRLCLCSQATTVLTHRPASLHVLGPAHEPHNSHPVHLACWLGLGIALP